MQFTVEVDKSFDQISFVEEREKAEEMVAEGWTPVWEPNAKIKDIEIPNYSNYYILVK